MESGFSDFISQIPIGLFVATCASATLVLVAIMAIIAARMRPAGPAKNTSATPPPNWAAPPDVDLPDLDLLTEVAAPPPAPKREVAPVTLNDGGSAQTVEVLTILRDVVDGGLVLKMGDKSYRTLAHDEQFRAAFMKIMRELTPLVRTEPDPAPPSAAAPDRGPSIAEPPAVEADLTGGQQAEPAPPRRKAMPEAPKGLLPGDLPTFELDKQKPITAKTGSGFLRRGKPDFEPVPELNIALAIESFLQHKLDYTTGFEAREIHVLPAPDGSVRIEVDGQYYETVDDVSDPVVRDFLKQTITEWQQRHG